MKYKNQVIEAKGLAIRFAAKCEEYLADDKSDLVNVPSKARASMKRASMDLSNALVFIRKTMP